MLASPSAGFCLERSTQDLGQITPWIPLLLIAELDVETAQKGPQANIPIADRAMLNNARVDKARVTAKGNHENARDGRKSKDEKFQCRFCPQNYTRKKNLRYHKQSRKLPYLYCYGI